MKLQLRVAREKDLVGIHEMQVQSFSALLVKYQDVNTNPALETLEDITERFHRSNGMVYKIQLDAHGIGAICISETRPNHLRISPIFIKPNYQKRGLAKNAVELLEKEHQTAKTWELQTIKEEKDLVRFYEKIGYVSIGEERVIKSGMTLLSFRKST